MLSPSLPLRVRLGQNGSMPIELSPSAARALVLPEYGGRLHQIWVPTGRTSEALLHSPDDVRDYTLRPTRGGSFPMAPWPNRVANGTFRWQGREYELPRDGKPHAIHGRVLSQTWSVVVSGPASCEMVAPLDAAWPWKGHAWQRFELSSAALHMELEVRSDGEPFPAGCGWHPWFRRDVAGAEEVRLLVPATRRYVLDDQIPTGEQVEPAGESDLRHRPLLGDRLLDDCYASLEGPAVIGWDDFQLAVAIEATEPHVMVYAPLDAICVESQTCAPDAFNLADRGVRGTGMAVAAPGSPVRIAAWWSWGSDTGDG